MMSICINHLRSRIAMYLHGRVIDGQGRALLEEAADALCRVDQQRKDWQRRAETAEAATVFHDAESAVGK